MSYIDIVHYSMMFDHARFYMTNAVLLFVKVQAAVVNHFRRSCLR